MGKELLDILLHIALAESIIDEAYQEMKQAREKINKLVKEKCLEEIPEANSFHNQNLGPENLP